MLACRGEKYRQTDAVEWERERERERERETSRGGGGDKESNT